MIKLDQEWEKARTALGIVFGALPHEATQIETYIELVHRALDGEVFEPDERAGTACESLGEDSLCGQCSDAVSGSSVDEWETDDFDSTLFFKPDHVGELETFIDGLLPDGNNGERAESP